MRWTSRFSRRTPCAARRPVRPATLRPHLEALEDRTTPVIDAYAPNPVPPGFVTTDGVSLDGVVQLNWPLPNNMVGTGSGAFLGDDERRGPTDAMTLLTRAGNAQHILTAAHCLTDENGIVDVPEVTVSFYLPGRSAPYTFKVGSANYRIHPAWDGNHQNGNDIALIDLGEIGPAGPVGIGATPYPINVMGDEVRNQFEFSGFGNTGSGLDGQQPGTSGVKRYGYNVFDAWFFTQVAYDFDSGDPWDNTLFWAGSAQTPVKTGDSLQGQGDSGGPAFLYDALAGITSWVLGESDPPDHDFGDIGFMERVSVHRDWIRGLMDVPRHVTLKMANQPFGNDGGADQIDVRRDGSRVLLFVNGHFWVDLPTAGVSSLTILGSNDNENIYVESSLRETVHLNGGGGDNKLFVLNTGDKLTYTVEADRVTCLKNASWVTTIFPQNVSHIEVAGDSADRVQVHGVRSGTPVTVLGAGTVDVGVRNSGNLGTINDTVTVNGTSTSLSINDDTWPSRRDYDLSRDRLLVDLFGVARTIRFSGLTVMELNGAGHGNEVNVFQTPAPVTRLYTGDGADVTQVDATSTGVLSIHGQAGLDTVSLGTGGSVQGILGNVRIDNRGGFTTVDVDNREDGVSRVVTMKNAANGYVTTTGLAPGSIGVAPDAVRRLTIWAGNGNDTFTVESTPLSPAPLGFGTTIRGGGGDDFFNIHRTVGFLTVEAGGGENLVRVGSNARGLTDIRGEVTADGQDGATSFLVNDAVTAATPDRQSYEYILDSDVVQRTDTAAIHYLNMANLSLFTSQATDFVLIRNTAPFASDSRGTFVGTSGGDDFVTIRGTGGYTRVDLGSGAGSVTAGDETNSLDAIRGVVDLTGAGFDVVVSNRASTTSQTATVSRSELFGYPAETLVRQELQGEVYAILNTFNVLFTGAGRIQYLAGRAGDTMFANGTRPNVGTEFHGSPGALDTFAVGFGADTNHILGPVHISAQATDNDFAYYYDYLNANPQMYDLSLAPSGQELIVERSGAAPVGFHDLGQVILYTPVVGGSTTNVRGLPARTYLNMAVGNGDRVTFGSNAPGLGGTLDDIRGPVSVGPGAVNATATLILDDSGNTTTGRDVAITSWEYQGIPLCTIEGLTPRAITFRDQDNWDVDLRGGGGDDRFVMTGPPLAARVSIDAGAGNDILVGSGGNVLRGGAGRDILIAGPTASELFGGDDEDLLIGGTLNDTSRENLEAIAAEWTLTGEGNDYWSRVSRLLAGRLSADQVTGNGGDNALTGGGGLDLFFGSFALDWEIDDGEVRIPL